MILYYTIFSVASQDGEPHDYALFRTELKNAEIQANHENRGMYVTFRGQCTFIEPNLPEMSVAEVEGRLHGLVEAAALMSGIPSDKVCFFFLLVICVI